MPIFTIHQKIKNPRKVLIYRDFLCFAILSSGETGISNPGYLAVQRFSRPPQSTTLPPLQDFFFQKYFLLKALQRYDFILNKQIVLPVFFAIKFSNRIFAYE